jgi:RNA polymerase sigma-70 factor, ECF subfamily
VARVPVGTTLDAAGNADASAPAELAVVRRAQAGDERAFEALYRAHAGRVFALCLRMAGDRERAQELAHDAFVRAWERLASFRGESAFGSWLHRLTVNVVLERLRGERRRQAHEVPGDDGDGDTTAGWDGAAPDTSAIATMWRRATREDAAMRLDLETAIARLPTNARTVFVLSVVEGYRHDEIAALMTIAEGTVRAHLHRARRLLMEFLSR